MKSSRTCTSYKWKKQTKTYNKNCFYGTQILDLADFQAASINLSQELKQAMRK